MELTRKRTIQFYGCVFAVVGTILLAQVVNAWDDTQPGKPKLSAERESAQASRSEAEQADPLADPDQIAAWVDDLSANSFQLRREAFIQLWRTGKPALAAIQAAMASTESQQATSAATLEALIRLSVPPEEPEQAAEFIRLLGSDPEAALVKLCQRGFWNVAEELMGADEELRASLRASPWSEARIMNNIVDEALEQNDLELAWPLVRQILPLPQALWIAHQLQLPLPTIEMTPANQAWQLFVQGKIQEAIATDAPVALRAQMALRSFLWPELIQPAFMNLLANHRQAASRLAAQVVLNEFAGNVEAGQKLWDVWLKKEAQALTVQRQSAPYDENLETDPALLAAMTALQADPVNLSRVQLALMLTGHARAVQDYLLANELDEAWSLCLARGDYRAAVSTHGLEPDFGNFDSWLESRASELHQDVGGFFADQAKFDKTAELAGLLLGLGRNKEADAIIEKLAAVCQASRQNEEGCWQSFARMMYRSEARNRFLTVVQKHYGKMSEKAREIVLQTLYSDLSLTIVALFETAPEIKDGAGADSKWEALEQLWLLNRSKFEPQGTRVLESWLRRARVELGNMDGSGQQLSELVELADGLGLSDLALQLVSDSEQAGVELWAQAAKFYLQRGLLDDAIEYYSAIRRFDGSQQEAIVDESNAVLMAGRAPEASNLLRSRWLRPMMAADDTNSWFGVARRMHEEERYDLALEYMQPAFMLFGADVQDKEVDPARMALILSLKYAEIADELKDYEKAANARRALLVTQLTANSRLLPPRFTLFVGSKERVHRATLAARAGDVESFKRHAYVAESLQPQGIEIVEDTYTDLVAAGHADIAQEIFNRMESRMLAHLELWPKDATAHNNLAWMYARCDQKLNEALSHSQQAVELAPHSAVLLDTLAEVYFRRGQIAEAIAAAQHCIELDPRDRHMRQQLDRFLKAQATP